MRRLFLSGAKPAPGAVVLALVCGIAAGAPAQELEGVPAAQFPHAFPSDAGSADPLMRAALERSFTSEPSVLAFYAARGFRPLWSDAGQLAPAAEAVLSVLREAPRHALPPGRYAAAFQAAVGPDWSPEREAAFTRAYLAYGRDVSSGILTPQRIDKDISLSPRRPDPGALLSGLADASDPVGYLRGLAPQDPEYALLMRELSELTTLAARPEPWGAEVPAGPLLEEGDRDPRVAMLRRRLEAIGDLAAPQPVAARPETTLVAANEVARDAVTEGPQRRDPQRFDAELADALRHFQSRHGLNQDGIVGPATLAQLNVSPAFRAEQVAVNLERMRWLNHDLGPRHVIVNIAGFTMRVIDHGRVAFDSRVIVGLPDHQTPEFSDTMEHIVVNPTWFVPRSIATKEILPQLKQDPSYLARKNMRLVGANEWDIDWSTVTPGTFPGKIRQNPGEDNALGRVKFMFPNDFSIYLHDTPQRQLFAKDVRAFSHGCVRVEKPIDFAHFLLSFQMSNPAEAFSRWLDSGRERYVQLQEHLPVYITYRTAWVDDAGLEQFRGDIYGRDAEVMDALRAAGVSLGVSL